MQNVVGPTLVAMVTKCGLGVFFSVLTSRTAYLNGRSVPFAGNASPAVALVQRTFCPVVQRRTRRSSGQAGVLEQIFGVEYNSPADTTHTQCCSGA